MPRNTLTVPQIVDAAITLLDAEGLEGLNMRSLGSSLGSAATAVYWHVESKDNLVRLATDEVWQRVELPALPHPDGGDWRSAARALAKAMHSLMSRHPWLVQVLASHLVYGHGKARFDEHSLAVYEIAGFTDAEADKAATTVFTFVLGNIVGQASTVSLNRRLARGGDNAEGVMRDAMSRARGVGQEYPRLRKRLDGPAAQDYASGPDGAFTFGLEMLLDGLESRLAAGKPQGSG